VANYSSIGEVTNLSPFLLFLVLCVPVYYQQRNNDASENTCCFGKQVPDEALCVNEEANRTSYNHNNNACWYEPSPERLGFI